jgi:hypothetical protein
MPATTEQRAWVHRVLIGIAEQPDAPAAPAQAADLELDSLIDRALQTPALSFTDLAVLFNTVYGRVIGTPDTAVLSKLAALGANDAGMSDTGGSSRTGAPSTIFSDLGRAFSDAYASALAGVDANALSKFAQVAAQDGQGSPGATAEPGKVFSVLATEFNGTFADIIAAVDAKILSKLSSAEAT